MSDQTTTQPKQPWWRRWTQFSLFSMLLLMLVAALAINWYRVYVYESPDMSERNLPGGIVLKTEMAERERDGLDADGQPAKITVEVSHGKFLVLDQHGRTLCKGQYKEDLASGWWEYYHPSGRTAMSGRCEKGCRVGVWQTWDENGNLLAEVAHGEPMKMELPKYLSFGVWRPKPEEVFYARREGPARSQWPGGSPRAKGEFKDDMREGTWTISRADVTQHATGWYRNGIRQGQWRINDAGRKMSRVVQYVEGREVADFGGLLAQLTADARSGNPRKLRDVMTACQAIGGDAAPVMQEVLLAAGGELRLQALLTLAQFGTSAQRALPDIDRMLDSGDVPTRSRALMAVCAIDPKRREESLDKLVALAKQSSGADKEEVLKDFARLGSAAIGRWEKMLESDDSEDRFTALLAVNSIIHVEQLATREDRVALFNTLNALMEKTRTTHPNQQTAKLAEVVQQNLQIHWPPSPPPHYRSPYSPMMPRGLQATIPVVG